MRDLGSPGDGDHWVQLCFARFSRFTRDPNGARSVPSLRRERVVGGRVCNIITNSPESGLMRDLDSSGDGDN